MTEFDKTFHDNPDHHVYGGALLVPLAPEDISTGTASAGIAPAAARADHVHHAGTLGFQGSAGAQGFQGSSGGGGSFDPVTDQAVYTDPSPYHFPVLQVDGETQIPWELSDGAALLDLTDPEFPEVVTTGLYAVTLNVTLRAGITGQQYYVALYVGSFGAAYVGAGTIDKTTLFETPPLAVTYYCAAGDVIQLRATIDGGSPGDDMTVSFYGTVVRVL